LDTAMSFPCSHNFCAICIRRSLTFRAKCPMCAADACNADLRNNRTLDYLVQTFTEFRDGIFLGFQKELGESSRRRDDMQRLQVALPPSPSPSSSSSSSQTNAPISAPAPAPYKRVYKERISRVTQDPPLGKLQKRAESFFKAQVQTQVQEPLSGSTGAEKLECPVCSLPIVAGLIDAHVTHCLARAANTEKPLVQAREVTMEGPERLLVCHNIMQMTQIRTLLRECGLSTTGKREALIERHKVLPTQLIFFRDN
jgi:E3 ubiquitin-protein ligase RAD18